MSQVHAFSDDAMGTHDASGLAEEIRQRRLAPDEVIDAAQRRLAMMEPHVSAVAARHPSPLSVGRPGAVFASVPTFIKDNLDLEGLPTCLGSEAIRASPAKRNDPFVEQFLSLGFVPLGKSRMPEFGLNASTEYRNGPPTRNPWHLEYSAGASSGGAAALVASGVVAIAHANDGGGSIRIPAASCGLVGLKPSRGRLIASRAARALPIDLIGEGVLTRSVRDTATFLYGAEQNYYNPKLPRLGQVSAPLRQRLRIAMIEDLPTGVVVAADVRESLWDVARLLESMGHKVEELVASPVPPTFAEDFTLYWGLLAWAASQFAKLRMGSQFDGEQLDELTKGLAGVFKRNAHRTPNALYRLRQSRDYFTKMTAGYDVILSPVLAHATPKLGYLKPDQQFEELFERLRSYVGFTPLNNVTGTPALSLPLGRSSAGLPLGIHFSAPWGAERLLLELAFALEEARPWRHLYHS